ncbi:MAG: hypothetical protein ACQZ3N_00725 [cyanobacterium endosymbiont of Rhopalodia yunnanensis]
MKRKAEQYLIKSGIGYAINRVGVLFDKLGRNRKLLVGHND